MAYRRRRRRRYYRPRYRLRRRRRRRSNKDSLRRAVQNIRKIRRTGLDMQLQRLQKFRRNYYENFTLSSHNYYLSETQDNNYRTYGRTFVFQFFSINNPKQWLGLWESAKLYRRVTNFYQKYTVYIRWGGHDDRAPSHVGPDDEEHRPHWRQVGLYVFMYPLQRNISIPLGIENHPLQRLAELPGCKVIHLKPPEYRGEQVRKMTFKLIRRTVHPKAGKDKDYDQIITSGNGFGNFSMTSLDTANDFKLQFVYMLASPTAPVIEEYLPFVEITVKKKAYLKFSEPNHQSAVRFEGDGLDGLDDSIE